MFRGYLPEPGAVAVDLQTQLQENLGITASIEVMESGAFIEESQAGNLDGIYLLGWTGDYPHITNFLDFHFTASNPQFGNQDPSYTEPLAAASKLADFAEAQPLYVEANNALKEFVPMVPIVHSATAFAFGADVDGAYAPPWGQVLLHLLDNGEDTLVFMQGNEPISLYCADESDGESLRACNQVVEALYGYAPNGDPVPQLATECAPNDDLSQWTCTLRDGVKFHDGSDLDASDVIASFTAGLDAASPIHVGNTGAWTYYSYLWDSLINVARRVDRATDRHQKGETRCVSPFCMLPAAMLSFIVRRTLYAIPVLVGIVVVVFFLIRAIPGEPCTAILGEQATEEACERFNEANGLNEPILVQLGIYLKNVATFNLGDSIRFSRPVNQLLIERLPLTIELGLAALTIAIVVGVPMGVVAARKHNTAVDSATMAFANVGVSMPVFWLGLMLAYVFALVLRDTPLALPPVGAPHRRGVLDAVLRGLGLAAHGGVDVGQVQ